MNEYIVKNSPTLYVEFIRNQLKAQFKDPRAPKFTDGVVYDLLSAFHGFNSWDAFERALNSFRGFDCYRMESIHNLRSSLFKQGFLNTYKYLTNFHGRSRITHDGKLKSDDTSIYKIESFYASEIARALVVIHQKNNLSFIDLLNVKYSPSIGTPSYVHKNDGHFIECIDFYSASFIARSILLKRAENVKHIVNHQYCNEAIHLCFKDVFGFFDIASYYTFLRVFKKITYRNATRLTGKNNINSRAFPTNKKFNNTRVMSDFDWIALSELVNVAVTQSHLNLARFYFRFFKHPSTTDRNIQKDDASDYDAFVSIQRTSQTANQLAV